MEVGAVWSGVEQGVSMLLFTEHHIYRGGTVMWSEQRWMEGAVCRRVEGERRAVVIAFIS